MSEDTGLAVATSRGAVELTGGLASDGGTDFSVISNVNTVTPIIKHIAPPSSSPVDLVLHDPGPVTTSLLAISSTAQYQRGPNPPAGERITDFKPRNPPSATKRPDGSESIPIPDFPRVFPIAPRPLRNSERHKCTCVCAAVTPAQSERCFL